MAYDPCSPIANVSAPVYHAPRHHIVHHVVGRVRHRVHHIHVSAGQPPAHVVGGCVRHAGRDPTALPALPGSPLPYGAPGKIAAFAGTVPPAAYALTTVPGSPIGPTTPSYPIVPPSSPPGIPPGGCCIVTPPGTPNPPPVTSVPEPSSIAIFLFVAVLFFLTRNAYGFGQVLRPAYHRANAA